VNLEEKREKRERRRQKKKIDGHTFPIIYNAMMKGRVPPL
jgi:hypothetical protein